jgi:hypothetical protein
MDHPLISNIDHMSTDELGAKINDLNRKLGIAINSGNGHLCSQLRMAIETFQTKYQEKLMAEYNKQLTDAKIDTKKIDIQ